MSEAESKVTARSSFCSSTTRPHIVPTMWKSDMCIAAPADLDRLTGGQNMFSDAKSSCGEYYKKYEHDEAPVKDSYSFTGTGDKKRSLTNSELDKLETQVLENMSQELICEEPSVCRLESHIKFFKSTVQQIFDNFYSHMRDFERYKEKYREILAKNKCESIVEMEQLIKDMIDDIMSTESMLNQGSGVTQTLSKQTFDGNDYEEKSQDENVQTEIETSTDSNSLIEQSFKNDNFISDTTATETSKCVKSRASKNSEIFNIYVMNASPCLEFKMNDRHMVSEINIRNSDTSNLSKVASAENPKKLAAKKKEIEMYGKCGEESESPERNIPIKISSAKKNIHLDEDFVFEGERNDARSIMTRICNYICRKIRKS